MQEKRFQTCFMTIVKRKTINQQTNTTFLMNKNKQKIGFKTQQIKHSFTATKLTKYAGLSPIMKFINKLKIGKQLNELFPTEKTREWIKKRRLTAITIDCDSTVETVYGKQQGAAKGYNPDKKGAYSYHPLIAFVSELKIVVNNRFRTGSAYTSNGICRFLKQTRARLRVHRSRELILPHNGFFSGELIDLLEKLKWEYLIKVK